MALTLPCLSVCLSRLHAGYSNETYSADVLYMFYLIIKCHHYSFHTDFTLRSESRYVVARLGSSSGFKLYPFCSSAHCNSEGAASSSPPPEPVSWSSHTAFRGRGETRPGETLSECAWWTSRAGCSRGDRSDHQTPVQAIWQVSTTLNQSMNDIYHDNHVTLALIHTVGYCITTITDVT